jgi:hypothetical protein
MGLARTFSDGFFDGFGPVGLFCRLQRPGAPVKVFAEEGDIVVALERVRPDGVISQDPRMRSLFMDWRSVHDVTIDENPRRRAR